MKHDYEKHEDHATDPDGVLCRLVCDGGLSICKICGGAEGSLTTDCPGVVMTTEQGDAVYAGRLDYQGGAWIGLKGEP